MRTYRSERPFLTVNGFLFIIMSLLMVAPMIHIIALSLTSGKFAAVETIWFWPKGFTLEVYKKIFSQESLWQAMGITVYITVVGTLISLFFTTTIAYALSRPQMPFRKLILKGIIVTFIFSVPLIPHFLLVKDLGMYNTLWAVMIPNALGAFNVIIMKTFFQGLSKDVLDAAYIDGCSEYGIYARIALPLSLPSIATIALFHAVGEWNTYFSALIFINNKALYPLQILLRNLLVQDSFNSSLSGMTEMLNNYTPAQIQAGVILFATVPILVVYPFIQKYFIKGAMLGSLKE